MGLEDEPWDENCILKMCLQCSFGQGGSFLDVFKFWYTPIFDEKQCERCPLEWLESLFNGVLVLTASSSSSSFFLTNHFLNT